MTPAAASNYDVVQQSLTRGAKELPQLTRLDDGTKICNLRTPITQTFSGPFSGFSAMFQTDNGILKAASVVRRVHHTGGEILGTIQ